MCSVMAGLGAALTLFSGYSNYQSQKAQIQAQADSQASYARAQAQADEYNARLAEQQAKVEARKQEQIADNYANEAEQLRDRHRLQRAAVRASAGAAGIDSTTGSAFDIQSSGQEAYWEDQATLLGNQRNDNYNSRVTQSNYMRNSESLMNSAENRRREAQNILDDADRQIGALGMTSILGTATSMVPFFSGLGGGSSNSGTTRASGSGIGYSGYNNPYIYKGATQTWAAPLRFPSR